MEDKIIKKRKRGFFAALTALVMAATSLSASAAAYTINHTGYDDSGNPTFSLTADEGDSNIESQESVVINSKMLPTCISDGTANVTINYIYNSGGSPSNGSKTQDVVLSHFDHIIQYVAEIPAKCEANGTKAHWECSRCHTKFENDDGTILAGNLSIPALGHDWDDGVVTLEPTTTSEGVRTFTCKRAGCGATYTLPIDKLPEETTTTSSRRSPIVTPPETTTTAYYNPDYVAPPTTTTTASPETTTTEATTTTTEAVTTVPETTPEETTTPVDDDTTTPPEPQEGDVIELTDPVVPAELLEQIKGKDVDVVIDLGNGLKWTINGKSITDDDLTDINLNVSIGDNGIPVQVINKVTGERFYISIHLDYDGPFPFDAELEVDLKKSNAGYYANLFYYNPELSDLEYVSSSIIDENGVAHLNFHHASDYTIVIDDKPFDGNYEDGEPEENPTTGVIPAGIAIASISAAAMLISYKRKK